MNKFGLLKYAKRPIAIISVLVIVILLILFYRYFVLPERALKWYSNYSQLIVSISSNLISLYSENISSTRKVFKEGNEEIVKSAMYATFYSLREFLSELEAKGVKKPSKYVYEAFNNILNSLQVRYINGLKTYVYGSCNVKDGLAKDAVYIRYANPDYDRFNMLGRGISARKLLETLVSTEKSYEELVSSDFVLESEYEPGRFETYFIYDAKLDCFLAASIPVFTSLHANAYKHQIISLIDKWFTNLRSTLDIEAYLIVLDNKMKVLSRIPPESRLNLEISELRVTEALRNLVKMRFTRNMPITLETEMYYLSASYLPTIKYFVVYAISKNEILTQVENISTEIMLILIILTVTLLVYFIVSTYAEVRDVKILITPIEKLSKTFRELGTNSHYTHTRSNMRRDVIATMAFLVKKFIDKVFSVLNPVRKEIGRIINVLTSIENVIKNTHYAGLQLESLIAQQKETINACQNYSKDYINEFTRTLDKIYTSMDRLKLQPEVVGRMLTVLKEGSSHTSFLSKNLREIKDSVLKISSERKVMLDIVREYQGSFIKMSEIMTQTVNVVNKLGNFASNTLFLAINASIELSHIKSMYGDKVEVEGFVSIANQLRGISSEFSSLIWQLAGLLNKMIKSFERPRTLSAYLETHFTNLERAIGDVSGSINLFKDYLDSLSNSYSVLREHLETFKDLSSGIDADIIKYKLISIMHSYSYIIDFLDELRMYNTDLLETINKLRGGMDSPSELITTIKEIISKVDGLLSTISA